jgi:hypothetical protein
VVQVETSKISGCTISLQAAVHPGASATGTQHYKKETKDGGGGSAPLPGRFNSGKDPVPIVQKVGWAPGPVWTGAENLAPTWIQSRPPRSVQADVIKYVF